MFLSPVVVRLDKSEVDLRISFCADVGLLSQPQFNPVVLDDFLRKKNMMDATELRKEASASALAEASGRICYMSFEKPRPGGSKAYHQHILEVGHGSTLEGGNYSFLIHGVSRSLTHELVRHRAGWAYCLAGDVVVYSGSKCNGKFEGVKKRWTMAKLYEMSLDPKRKGRLKLIKLRCYDGEKFVQAKLKKVVCSGVKDLLEITLSDGKKIKSSADHRFLTADGWKTVRELQVGQALATNGLPALGLDRDWLEKRYCKEKALLRDIAKEAGCSPHTLRSYLRRYGLQKAQGQGMLGRTPPNKGKRYSTGYKHSEETKKRLSEQKRGPSNPAWMGDKASAQAGRFRAQKLFPSEPCESCGVAEGHRHHKDRNTLNNARSNIEFLCAPCHGKRHFGEDGPTNLLKIRWVAIQSIVPAGRGMTYDLEVDHESHNFVANGFVTHNSQLSQRFVDERQVSFVVPPKMLEAVALALVAPEANLLFEIQHKDREFFRDLPGKYSEIKRQELQRIGLKWLKNRETNLLEYRDTTDALYGLYESQKQAMSPTDFRKMLRQTARNCLPNCTETYLVATANIRALRHMIAMRGAKAADEEIRNFALRVAAIMKEAEPLLFQDLTIEEDHCFFKYPKV